MNRRELFRLSMLTLGTMATGSVSRALLAEEAAAPTASPFSDKQAEAVRLLSEMIIPTTDTPGAVAAGVPDFIADIVANWYTDTERGIFLEGLAALDRYTQEKEGKPFHLASEAVRDEALSAQESLAKDYKPPERTSLRMMPGDDENAPFFKKIRELVVLGYYTSEVGAKQELVYLPMPGYFDGNFDFSEVGRQWTH